MIENSKGHFVCQSCSFETNDANSALGHGCNLNRLADDIDNSPHWSRFARHSQALRAVASRPRLRTHDDLTREYLAANKHLIEPIEEVERVRAVAEEVDSRNFLRLLDSHEALRQQLARVTQEREEAKADTLDWMLCAEGTKHDPRCANHFAGQAEWGPCLRCQRRTSAQSGWSVGLSSPRRR